MATSGSKGLCNAFRRVFATFGVPREISSDGGPEFTAAESLTFYRRWGSHHRLSSAYNPQSNGRAEVAVKSMKRLLEKNIGPDGNLNSDKVVRALLQVRNTPDRHCKLSPAEILFGRRLRDATPQLDKNLMMFANPIIDERWHSIWEAKEYAIRNRAAEQNLRTSPSFKDLKPLLEGDTVLIQNQNPSSGNPKKWNQQGEIVATGQFDQYLVRVAGSGRLTLRNRRFLRKVSHVHAQRNQTVARPPVNSHDAPALSSPSSSTKPVRCMSGDPPQPALYDGAQQNTLQEPVVLREESVEDIGISTEGATEEPRRRSSNIQRGITTTDVAEDTVLTPRRWSNRQTKQTEFYDASTGKSVHARDSAVLEGGE